MKYVALDFETTGNQPGDEIIQVGLAVIEDYAITARYASFVKPKQAELSDFIKQLTGIDETLLADAPSLEDVITEMLPYLKDAILIAHHASFDLSFLQRALEICGYAPYDGPVLDTIEFLRIVFPELSSLQLSMVSQTFELEHDQPHRADSDAIATAQIWLQCLEKLERLPLITLQRLVYLFDHAPTSLQDMAWFLKELCAHKEQEMALEAVDADQHRYFRQFALNVEDWTEEEHPREQLDPIDLQMTDSFDTFYTDLKQRFAAHYDKYESRQAQEHMINNIYTALHTGKHLMVEAGTGTGKSLGYLIPSLYYSVQTEQKIVVSTHTINLQEQIRQRDIPLLHELFPVPFSASVLKGRSHYLCLRKFEHKMNSTEELTTKDDILNAAQMIIWLTETEHGEDEEIHFGNKGREFWHSVASDADSCLNRVCPWFRKCFYHRAKHRANLADIVITNHSLLFTDVKAEHRLIPSYNHLVVDEAHHFEEVAGKHLGQIVSYMGLTNTLTLLYRDQQNGHLPLLQQELQLSGIDAFIDESNKLQNCYERIVKIKENWDQLTEWLYQNCLSWQENQNAEAGQLIMRIKPSHMPEKWEVAKQLEDNIYVEASQLIKQVERIVLNIKEKDEAEELQGFITDISGMVKDITRMRDTIRTFVKTSDSNTVYWLEASTTFKSKSLQMNCIPIDVSPILRDAFFEKKESVILTSATLSVGKSFDHAAEQLGLSESMESGRVMTSLLPSPFEYRKNVLVCIPRDFPKIKGGASGDEQFVTQLISSLTETAIATKGRMLVLFTSYRMLKKVHAELKTSLQEHGIDVLGQGIDSGNRSKLTRRFQSSEACVLLGTSSFWEGVDIPGQALTCLVLVRLPFQPPNHPIVEAKSEYLREQRKNPFMDYAVPQAVIRFKQGFGRLVRTSDDYGIVILYDTRVIDTRYGKHFLYSLPGPKIEHMPGDGLVPRIKEWLEQRGQMDENRENI